MSQGSLHFNPFVAISAKSPQETGINPAWALWAERLEALLSTACKQLGSRAKRARRLTITLESQDGRRFSRSLTLPRALREPAAMRPAALGVFRLLLAEGPTTGELRIALRLDALSASTQGPIVFKSYLNRKKKARLMEGLRRWCPFF